MSLNLSDVRLLQDVTIHPGDRWIYTADFNIQHDGPKLRSAKRVDAEIDDLKQIIEAGGIAAILAHKGRFGDQPVEELDFVAPYLSEKLGAAVEYYPENATNGALDFVRNLEPGGVAVMGNSRMHKGEEENSLELAEAFARLGERVAVGGFGKAHRNNASNVGVLEFLPGYLTRSQVGEMELLAPWAGKDDDCESVAVLGGVKREKITIGLAGLVDRYDYIIPGGIVLNTILAAEGFDVGASILKDGGKMFESQVREILDGETREKICIPDRVTVARADDKSDPRPIPIVEGVPDGYMIVDFEIPDRFLAILDRVAGTRGRIVLAGTPSISTAGFTQATDAVLKTMRKPGVRGLVMGGDTAVDVEYSGTVSGGGGSALYFLANGTTLVYEALRANRVSIG